MIDQDYDDMLHETANEVRQERLTFTCNQCHTSGSELWMRQHDCQHNQYVNDNGGRCEDYPCCGHTDGDGCRTLESHTSEYWTERLIDLQNQGYDDYDIDMMLSREDY